MYKLIQHFAYEVNGQKIQGSQHIDEDFSVEYLKNYAHMFYIDNPVFKYTWLGDWEIRSDNGNPVRRQRATGCFSGIEYAYTYEIIGVSNE